MPNEDDNLSEEEKLALEKAKEEKKASLSDEDFEAEVEKRFGVKPTDLIKKSEQIKVLSDEEKKEEEDKKQSAALKFALDNGDFKKSEYDEYLTLKSSNKVDIARKKFIDLNKELGEEAGKIFDTIIRIDEDDENEVEEKMVTNKTKKAAIAWAEKIADEELNSRFGEKIINLPKKFEEHLAVEAIKKTNSQLIEKVITEIPKRLEIDVTGEKYGIELTDEDFSEAKKLIVDGALGKKDLTAKEVQSTVNSYLMAKNLVRLIQEGIRVEVGKAVDEVERGNKGVNPDRKANPADTNAKMKFLEKRGIKV